MRGVLSSFLARFATTRSVYARNWRCSWSRPEPD
jgi:hypothetical protein